MSALTPQKLRNGAAGQLVLRRQEVTDDARDDPDLQHLLCKRLISWISAENQGRERSILSTASS